MHIGPRKKKRSSAESSICPVDQVDTWREGKKKKEKLSSRPQKCPSRTSLFYLWVHHGISEIGRKRETKGKTLSSDQLSHPGDPLPSVTPQAPSQAAFITPFHCTALSPCHGDPCYTTHFQINLSKYCSHLVTLCLKMHSDLQICP